jgi:hypothetical protein
LWFVVQRIFWAKAVLTVEKASLAAWRCSLAAGGSFLALVHLRWSSSTGIVLFSCFERIVFVRRAYKTGGS